MAESNLYFSSFYKTETKQTWVFSKILFIKTITYLSFKIYIVVNIMKNNKRHIDSV